jgi:hypothetical protein
LARRFFGTRRRKPRNSAGAKKISEDVVAELDASTEKRAQATAGEGAEFAAAAGFDARPLAPRARARAVERDTATIWRAVLAAADEEDAEVIVLGSAADRVSRPSSSAACRTGWSTTPPGPF